MAISYPISLPATPGSRRVKWDFEFTRARARSPFTAKSQKYLWPGKLLRVGVEYPPMARAEAEQWIATLYALDAGECLFGDPQGQTPRGLISGYATNAMAWSEEFQRSTWTKSGSSITPDATTAPTGLVRADKLVEDSANSQHLVLGPSTTPQNGETWVASIYVKPAERTQINLRFRTRANSFPGATFTLSGAGSVSSVSGGYTASIADAGSGWYRCTLSGSIGTGATVPAVIVYLVNAGADTYLGDGASGVHLSGAQLEKAAAASSYKPIGGTPVYSDIARDCLNFDGADDYVTIAHNAAYNSNNLTLELWFRAPSAAPAASKYLASKWDGAGFDREFSLILGTDGKLSFIVSKTDNTADVAAASAGTFLDGKWHHVAAVKAAGGALTLYVDGKQEGTGALGQEGDQTTHAVLVGNVIAGAHASAFSGPICEVRLWNTARTLTQVRDNLGKQLVGNESGLVGYWRFDEATGAALDDLTTTNNNGTRSGAAWSGLPATEMLVANLPAGYAAVFELGDWAQLGSGLTQRIYKTVGSDTAVAAAAASAAGVAHLELRPGLREVPADQATLTTANTRGVFELEEVVVGHEVDVAEKYGIAIQLVEAF